jgi:hypothetical protein
MAKKKQRGNGAGTVYPRKNKPGKVIYRLPWLLHYQWQAILRFGED